MVFTVGDTVTFALLVGAALGYRRRPEVHKRLMLLAMVGAMMYSPPAHFIFHTPALQAIPNVIVPMQIPLYFAGAIHDKLTGGKFHPVTLWGAVLLLAWGTFRAVVIRCCHRPFCRGLPVLLSSHNR
jgi:hypothetical protein